MTMETPPPPAPAQEPPWKISGRIAPARLGPLYKLGTVLTALAMLLLPLLYVGLIVAVGWEVYDVCVWGAERPESSNYVFFVVPVGLILIVFMIKPLFARGVKSTPALEVTREQEPRLFSFIDQICAQVRAPRPRRVAVDLKVNASASFTRGLLGLSRNQLTLTIGLPLVTGLTVRQLGGVFAHEFGHFAQGAGMRLTYLIRTINAWFGRLVYQRDSWDSTLREAARRIDIRIGIIFYLAMLMVWLTRKVLWVFMWLGHGISCFMMRQMEYDADYYETQVAGSDAFLKTCQALPVIGAGWQRAVSRQQESYAARRLVDDLATFTALETQRVSPETKAEIVKRVKGAKTGWFDTHPTDFDRMRIAHHAKAPGVLSGEEPATALFGRFPELARQVTAEYYRRECEIDLAKVQLLPLDQVAGEAEALAESDKATQDFFKSLLTIRTLVAVSADELYQVPPTEQLRAEARAAVSRHTAAVAAIADPVKALLAADRAGVVTEQARALLAAGFKIKKPAEFGLKKANAAGVEAALAESRLQVTKHREALGEPLAATRARLATALRAYFLKPLPAGLDAAATDEVERLARIVGHIGDLAEIIPRLRNSVAACGLLLRNRPEQISTGYVGALRRMGTDIANDARIVTGKLCRLEYPFGHAREHVLLSDFLSESGAHADESVEAYLRGQVVLDRLLTLYHHIMGRLAQLALQGESALSATPE